MANDYERQARCWGGGGGRGVGGVGLFMYYPGLAWPGFRLKRVWFLESWVYNSTIWRLWQVVFLDQKSVMAADERSTFGNNVFLKFFEITPVGYYSP